MGKKRSETFTQPRLVGSAATGGLVRPATPAQIAELEELYAQVPDVACQGLCQAACGPIGMGDAEYARLQGPGMPPICRSDLTGVDVRRPASCPALTILGQCGVYQLRPMVCRIWGAVASLRCPHGCRPPGGFLDETLGQILLMRSLMVGATPQDRVFYRRLIDRLEGGDVEMSQAMAGWVAVRGAENLHPETEERMLRGLERTLMRAARQEKNPHRRRSG